MSTPITYPLNCFHVDYSSQDFPIDPYPMSEIYKPKPDVHNRIICNVDYSPQVFPTDPHPIIEIYIPDVHNRIICCGSSSRQDYMITSGSCTGRFITKDFNECHCSNIRAQLLAQGITGSGTVILNSDCSINLFIGVLVSKAK